ncbi:MAG: hypothetical protein B6229_05270 [Spirochaetaceae bacterium 4572_7]|nr:MAG: hypothetical protein B6229_05270 [Spirochaetaceae bacterium 4572_7]
MKELIDKFVTNDKNIDKFPDFKEINDGEDKLLDLDENISDHIPIFSEIRDLDDRDFHEDCDITDHIPIFTDITENTYIGENDKKIYLENSDEIPSFNEQELVHVEIKPDITNNFIEEKVNTIDIDSSEFNENELSPNTTYIVDGVKHETDDKGNVFKVDGKLLPNFEYEINGYKYTTDDKGRIIEASGQLQLSEAPRKNQEDVNGMRDTDQRGHIIGHQFGGSNKIENLVAQDSNLNMGAYKSIEMDCAKALKEGKEVTLEVEIEYDSDSERPTSFTVIYTIDGETYEKTLLNESNKE